MKRIFIALGVVSMIGFVSCKEKASNKIETANVQVAAERDAAAKNLPVMTFNKAEHDFGTINQGTPQETTFTFTNTGNAPLIITNATSSCGCTVPEYPKNTPIAPGETGELLVKFNGSGQNQVTKTITVSANTEKGSELLRIKAFVQPNSGAPAANLGPVK
ncbi:DUF1573 domain-containing protein [Muriicola sp. E247]|uniref:DUF1573 domain-containing protein n=1 Tax=unclassified Muriicola TaxID=2647561 RepID=UPI0017EF0B17|nr:DUF1573 domain-containing protein [Muriicola sp.]NNC61316.1 DUF1573 domain-containing protein [Eudoraea sp.]NNK19657.1 DUF1573 domain-containing protein [Flavobacteriaceae bacterium]MBT8289764.1 DUF1573 domain-containing protein [Muriicola sp.]NNK34957.1 DUF1573 domain-containing protein [Eudoraea sp.]